jgi:hypothetical protein
VRLEVKVSRDDAPLVRRVVHALRDDRGEAASVRDRLNKAIGADRVLGLKELLAAAPLEGVDLSRSRRRPRPVHL